MQNLAIVIEGKRYHYQDINDLPYNLSLEHSKTVVLDTGIAFQLHASFLSSMYPCDFTYDNKKYSSVEQAFAHAAALSTNNQVAAAQIMHTQDPYKVKAMTKRMKLGESWAKASDRIILDIITAKFTQNPHLTQKLRDTGNANLYEATVDRRYGCGYTLRDRDKIGPTAPGRNLMGKLLEKVRDEILT